jgi:hypothetical protein
MVGMSLVTFIGWRQKMATPQNPTDKTSQDKSQQTPTSGPSGATDKPVEREKKFEDEGGGQPQGVSEDPDSPTSGNDGQSQGQDNGQSDRGRTIGRAVTGERGRQK